tara:strand:+ start:182 stop:538 length:357 start_codon:yes stop_codon:yes gene_type:complete
MGLKSSRTLKVVDKPWGREEWITLTDHYCLKKIYVNKGQRLSLQHHNVKLETMYVWSGEGELFYDGGTLPMKAGDVFTILPKKTHRVTASKNKDLLIVEVSTPEVDDIVREEDDYNRE